MKPGHPTPPIEFSAGAAQAGHRLGGKVTEITSEFLDALRAACAILDTAPEALAEAGRDWWPLALHWALEGDAPAIAGVIARPSSVEEVRGVVRLCDAFGIPLTAAGGRSGVCGASIPVFGGVVLDCCSLVGILAVDNESLLVDVAAGTFGPALEQELASQHNLTIGHWPQSIDLSTVGGWIACRGAGQYSTRYGKIEDIVAGLEVVLANGEVVRTGSMAGAGPRSAMGPDLTQIFVGSEGTLGIITAARLRAHPVAPAERRVAYGCESFEAGLEVLRRTLRRSGTPAVLRLYDEAESQRSFGQATNVLIALDEGDPTIIDASMAVLTGECEAAGCALLDEELVGRWMSHRNDVSALASVTRAGIIVDTIEISGPWSSLPAIYQESVAALRSIDGCLAASAHESHAYGDGACLYFTFAGRNPEPQHATPAETNSGRDPSDTMSWNESFYRAAWAAVLGVTQSHGGSISHHHGIGLVRGQYLKEALGEGFGVLKSLKSALDPNGILNPGKLGLDSPFGATPWS